MGGKGNRSLLGGGPLVPKSPPRARPQVVESTEPLGGFRGNQFSPLRIILLSKLHHRAARQR
jgi:hypothetical protein